MFRGVPIRPKQKSIVKPLILVFTAISFTAAFSLFFVFFLDNQCISVHCFPVASMGSLFAPSTVRYYLHGCSLSPVSNESITASVLQGPSSPESVGHRLSALALYFSEFVEHDLVRLPGLLPKPGDNGLGNCPSFVNDASPYIDGEQIYSTNVTYMSGTLRTGTGGTLRMRQGGFLPLNAQETMHVSGDHRADQSVPILALHTLWLREHNWWAAEFAKRINVPPQLANPSALDEYLFLTTRRFVIAEMQGIVYHEWLPAMLGESSFQPDLVDQVGIGPNTIPISHALVSTHHFPLYPSILNQATETPLPTNFTLQQIEYPPPLSGLSLYVEPMLAGLWSTAVNRGGNASVPVALAGRASLALNLSIEAGIPDWPGYTEIADLTPVLNATRPALIAQWKEPPSPHMSTAQEWFMRAAFTRVRNADPNYFDGPGNLMPQYWKDAAKSTTIWDVIRRNFAMLHPGPKRNLFLV